MNLLRLSVVLILFGMFGVVHAEDSFRVYAPSRLSQSLLIAKATHSNASLSLKLEEQVELGFSCATIFGHPTKPLIYVTTNRTTDNSSGALIRLDDSGKYASHDNFQIAHGYSYISLDRTNHFLLGANYSDGQIDVYRLGENGLPTKQVAALDEGRRNAHCVLPTPDNRFVYIPYVKDTNAIHQYAFDPDSGSLTALARKNAEPPVDTGPRHMAYHPKLPIAYFSNEQHLGVSVYEREESGNLKLRQVCDAVEEETPIDGVSSSDISITPDGKYLFAGIRGHKRAFDWISRYRILASGEVELLGLTPTDKIPWGLTLSPDGRYLLVSAFEGATLLAYKIGDGGDLAKAASLAWDKQISDLVTVR